MSRKAFRCWLGSPLATPVGQEQICGPGTAQFETTRRYPAGCGPALIVVIAFACATPAAERRSPRDYASKPAPVAKAVSMTKAVKTPGTQEPRPGGGPRTPGDRQQECLRRIKDVTFMAERLAAERNVFVKACDGVPGHVVPLISALFDLFDGTRSYRMVRTSFVLASAELPRVLGYSANLVAQNRILRERVDYLLEEEDAVAIRALLQSENAPPRLDELKAAHDFALLPCSLKSPRPEQCDDTPPASVAVASARGYLEECLACARKAEVEALLASAAKLVEEEGLRDQRKNADVLFRIAKQQLGSRSTEGARLTIRNCLEGMLDHKPCASLLRPAGMVPLPVGREELLRRFVALASSGGSRVTLELRSPVTTLTGNFEGLEGLDFWQYNIDDRSCQSDEHDFAFACVLRLAGYGDHVVDVHLWYKFRNRPDALARGTLLSRYLGETISGDNSPAVHWIDNTIPEMLSQYNADAERDKLGRGPFKILNTGHYARVKRQRSLRTMVVDADLNHWLMVGFRSK